MDDGEAKALRARVAELTRERDELKLHVTRLESERVDLRAKVRELEASSCAICRGEPVFDWAAIDQWDSEEGEVTAG